MNCIATFSLRLSLSLFLPRKHLSRLSIPKCTQPNPHPQQRRQSIVCVAFLFPSSSVFPSFVPSFIFPREGKRAACSAIDLSPSLPTEPERETTSSSLPKRTRCWQVPSKLSRSLPSSFLPLSLSLSVSRAKKYLACSLPSEGAGLGREGKAERARPAFYATSGRVSRPSSKRADSPAISLWRCKCYPRNTRATKCSEAGRARERGASRNAQTKLQTTTGPKRSGPYSNLRNGKVPQYQDHESNFRTCLLFLLVNFL